MVKLSTSGAWLCSWRFSHKVMFTLCLPLKWTVQQTQRVRFFHERFITHLKPALFIFGLLWFSPTLPLLTRRCTPNALPLHVSQRNSARPLTGKVHQFCSRSETSACLSHRSLDGLMETCLLAEASSTCSTLDWSFANRFFFDFWNVTAERERVQIIYNSTNYFHGLLGLLNWTQPPSP